MRHIHLFALLAATLAPLGVAHAQKRILTPNAPATEIGQAAISRQLLQRMALRSSINANFLVKSPTIFAARGELGTDKLNQTVEVRGFYYDGSIPMVVDDIERVNCDTLMPAQSYVPLAQAVPDLKNGDEVTVSGRLVTPQAIGLKLENEGSVLKFETPVQQAVKRVGTINASKLRLDPNLKVRIPGGIFQLTPQKYAVLLVGGGDAANNHLRYWNDLKTMNAILVARGYKKSNITVIYADGVAKDASMSVNYSASKANVNKVFKDLGDKLGAQDELYVMVNDHGGGFLGQQSGSNGPGSYGALLDASNSVGTAWSEAAFNRDLNYDGDKNDTVHFHNTVCLWGELMTEDEFGAALDQVKNVKTEMLQMKQCFSGGFTQRLNRANRVVMSSCGPNEFSWGHSKGNYGSFTYYYFSALTGKTPDGGLINGSSSVNADANGDGKVTLAEAWNYAKSKNPAPETALYADTASAPVSGTMPMGGQGALGGFITP